MQSQVTSALPNLIRSDTVKAWFGDISDMTLWRWVHHRDFPAPVKLCGRNYWDPTEVERWQLDNIEA